MTILERLRQAVAYVSAGMSYDKAAERVQLDVEDVRLAVLAPASIDKFALRIAARLDDTERPQAEARARSTCVSSGRDDDRQRKAQTRASEPVTPVSVSRAKALRTLGVQPPPVRKSIRRAKRAARSIAKRRKDVSRP